MKPLALEWVVKSEAADFATASREMRARKSPNFDAVCFHSQQCAEKRLKALLVEEAIPFSKTHDLIRLLDLLIPIYRPLELLRPHLAELTDFAVEFQYPGESADKQIAQIALGSCKLIRQEISLILPF